MPALRRLDPPDTWSAQMERALGLDRPVVISRRQRYSGHEILAFAGRARAWLSSLDLPRGTPVPALVSDTATALGLMLAGADGITPLAPLGPRLTVEELAAAVHGLHARAIVAEARHTELARDVAWRLGIQAVIAPDPAEDASPAATRETTGRPHTVARPAPGPQDVALVLHTSGTTGAPRAVACRQAALAARVRAYTALIPLDAGDLLVSAAGFYHIAGSGSVAVALAAGAAVVGFPEFSVDAWRDLDGLGVTHALVVPAMIEMLLAADALPLRGLRALQYGGAPIRPETLARVVDALPDVRLTNLFGQTEGSPLCALTADDHVAIRDGDTTLLTSVGRPVPGVEIRVEDPDAAGVGAISARAAHVFAGGADGWIRTGDLGWVDERGYVRLAGRAGDTICRGGENVRPVEVENVLRSHEGVADVAVAAVPDDRLGEEVGAWVVPVDPANPPAHAELAAHARTRLAGFKIPRVWTDVHELPRGAGGKLLRRVLRDEAARARRETNKNDEGNR